MVTHWRLRDQSRLKQQEQKTLSLNLLHTHTLLTNQRSEVISESLSTAEKRQTSDSNNTAESRTKSPSVTANRCLQTHSWKVIGYGVPHPPTARRGAGLHPTPEEQHTTCLNKLLRDVEASVYQTLVSPGAARDALLTISCCTNKSLPVLMLEIR